MMFYAGVANHDGVIEIMRHKTRQIHVGSLAIGGDAPIVVQSMTTTYTRDVDSTVAQIYRLEEVGCEIVRVAVPEEEDALAIGEIKKVSNFPWDLIFLINLPRRLTPFAHTTDSYLFTLANIIHHPTTF